MSDEVRYPEQERANLVEFVIDQQRVILAALKSHAERMAENAAKLNAEVDRRKVDAAVSEEDNAAYGSLGLSDVARVAELAEQEAALAAEVALGLTEVIEEAS